MPCRCAVTSTSMFSGNDTTRSTKERLASKPRARNARARAELGNLGREKSRHIDHGGVVLAERLDVERHEDGSLLAACTARAIGWFRSATTSYDTLRSRTRLSRRSHFTTRLPRACPP